MSDLDMIRKACNGDRPGSPYRKLLTIQDCITIYQTEKATAPTVTP